MSASDAELDILASELLQAVKAYKSNINPKSPSHRFEATWICAGRGIGRHRGEGVYPHMNHEEVAFRVVDTPMSDLTGLALLL